MGEETRGTADGLVDGVRRSGGLAGKTALVTGASRGIGAACARALAEEGMNLCLLARSREDLDAVARECRRFGVDALAVPCDVTSRMEVERAVEKGTARFGTIDLVVSNAGLATYKRFLELTEAEWDEMYAVNLKGTFLLLQAILPGMVAAQSGMVIIISSTRGFEALPTTAGYSATKFGVMGLGAAVAKDMAEFGIRVSMICPSGVRTWLRGTTPDEKDPSWLEADAVAGAVVYAAKVPYPAVVSQLNLVSFLQ